MIWLLVVLIAVGVLIMILGIWAMRHARPLFRR